MQDRIAYQGITFDDVLLEPGYSELLPKHVDVRSRLTSRISLNIPNCARQCQSNRNISDP